MKIETTKGDFQGTLKEVIAWQSEFQGGLAVLVIGELRVDVDGVDFDAEEPGRTRSLVLREIRAELGVTLAQVCALRTDAGEHGDLEQVKVCNRALARDPEALIECARVLAAACAAAGG